MVHELSLLFRPRQGRTQLALIALTWTLAGIGLAAPQPSSALPDAFAPEDLVWEIELGTHQYTVPKLDRGRLYIGINDWNLEHPAVKKSGGGILMCLDPTTGEPIWQLPIPRYMEGTQAPFHFNHWKCGVCSQPAIHGDTLFIVGPRGDVLCLDRDGQADGNDGPFVEERRYIGVPDDADYELSKTDADIIWRYDLIRELEVIPHDVCGSSPLLLGDHLYVCTSNGHDDKHRRVANPEAPSLIVLDRATGRLLATDGGLFGERLLHGNWSSPRSAQVDGRDLILFSGGDGVLYAFEPLDGQVSDAASQTLKIRWQYDCHPPDYRQRDGQPIPYARWNKKSQDGPSEALASPVVHQGRVYVTIGQSPVHGPGQGQLSCVDLASGRKLWASREVERALSEVLIHEGLLYISDLSGRLHCFDAESGQRFWSHELGAAVWTSSPAVIHDRVYVSTEKNVLWIFKAAREKEIVSRSRARSVPITPVFDEDMLFFPTQKRLFAVRRTKAKS